MCAGAARAASGQRPWAGRRLIGTAPPGLVTAMPAPLTLAYHGAPGAFAEAACARIDPDALALPFPSVAAAAAAVRSGRCERAVLPLRNSVAGPIPVVIAATADLVKLREEPLPIRMALLGTPGARVADLRVVASHPVALAQCAGLIARLGVRAEAAESTAQAAAALAASKDVARAVLGSAAAAAAHGLQLLMDDVGDDRTAVTWFGLFGPSA